jgi:ribosomal protein S21
MVEVRRRKGETFESLLRRFKYRLQMSGRLLQARKIRFYQPTLNKTARKRAALRRLELQAYYEKLRKMGKLPEKPSAPIQK